MARYGGLYIQQYKWELLLKRFTQINTHIYIQLYTEIGPQDELNWNPQMYIVYMTTAKNDSVYGHIA